MRRFFCILPLFVLLVLVAGCRVHQWPEPKERVPVVLRLRYHTDFYVWDHIYDPETGVVSQRLPDTEGVDADHPATSSVYDGALSQGTMRYVIRAYKDGNLSRFTNEFIFTRDVADGYDCDLPLELWSGDYELFVWSDLVLDDSEHFYNTGDFMRIALTADPYQACTDLRDAYRGTSSVSLHASSETTEVVVPMRRPMGKFELVTTDLKEFLNKENARGRAASASIADYTVRIHYPGYLPDAYNVLDDRLVDSRTGVSFTAALTPLNDTEASIGFDYVLINDVPNASVAIQVEILNAADERVAVSYLVSVPLRRDHHTVLRSPFMTLGQDGGVYIDPDFDGDYNIIL